MAANTVDTRATAEDPPVAPVAVLADKTLAVARVVVVEEEEKEEEIRVSKGAMAMDEVDAGHDLEEEVHAGHDLEEEVETYKLDSEPLRNAFAPEPTGVEKIMAKMQEVRDKTAAATTHVVAGGVYVKDKAVLVKDKAVLAGTYLTETSMAAGACTREKVASAAYYLGEKSKHLGDNAALATNYLGETLKSIKIPVAVDTREKVADYLVNHLDEKSNHLGGKAASSTNYLGESLKSTASLPGPVGEGARALVEGGSDLGREFGRGQTTRVLTLTTSLPLPLTFESLANLSVGPALAAVCTVISLLSIVRFHSRTQYLSLSPSPSFPPSLPSPPTPLPPPPCPLPAITMSARFL
jgi:hypothetical protein